MRGPIINQDLKDYAKQRHVKLGQVAEAMDIAQEYLSKLLRRNLPPEVRQWIISIINQLGDEYDRQKREGEE